MALRDRVTPILDDGRIFTGSAPAWTPALGLAPAPELPPLSTMVPTAEEARKMIADLGGQRAQEGLYFSENMPTGANINNNERVPLPG